MKSMISTTITDWDLLNGIRKLLWSRSLMVTFILQRNAFIFNPRLKTSVRHISLVSISSLRGSFSLISAKIFKNLKIATDFSLSRFETSLESRIISSWAGSTRRNWYDILQVNNNRIWCQNNNKRFHTIFLWIENTTEQNTYCFIWLCLHLTCFNEFDYGCTWHSVRNSTIDVYVMVLGNCLSSHMARC